MELRKKGVLKSLQDLKTFWDHMLSRENDTERSAVATAAVHRGQQGVCVRVRVRVCAWVFASRLFKYTTHVTQLGLAPSGTPSGCPMLGSPVQLPPKPTSTSTMWQRVLSWRRVKKTRATPGPSLLSLGQTGEQAQESKSVWHSP